MKMMNQYALDESNPLQSVTHERDLDEFLANAALADADFTTGESVPSQGMDRMLILGPKKGRRRGSYPSLEDLPLGTHSYYRRRRRRR